MKPEFKTEAELCAAFIDWLKRKHSEWTAYAETEGWDILLVHADGTQIGIQAKLRFNMAVLSQAIESYYSHDTGPDFRAVLVPPEERGYGEAICNALGLVMIRADNRFGTSIDFLPDLSDRSYARWHYFNPQKRCPLPIYVPDVPAGVPAPSVLTKWKIAALQVCAVIELRGYVTRQDFSLAGIDHRRWTQDWLEAVPERPGAWRWPAERLHHFEKQHPTIYPQILEKVRSQGLAKELTLL